MVSRLLPGFRHYVHPVTGGIKDAPEELAPPHNDLAVLLARLLTWTIYSIAAHQ
jgi:hypothetical protein